MNFELQQLRLPIALALKWCALVDCKISHLADLQKSERWNCYYSERQLLSVIEDAKRARDKWDRFVQRELPRANQQGSSNKNIEEAA